MNEMTSVRPYLFVALATLALGGCKDIVDKEQQGLFVLANQSGHDVNLTVFSTQNRSKIPLTLALPNGSRLERAASGGAGAIAYPELFFQGDSVRFLFADGRQLLHYCPQSQQLSGRCVPQAHNILKLQEYAEEPISEAYRRYTYTLTSADYAAAR